MFRLDLNWLYGVVMISLQSFLMFLLATFSAFRTITGIQLPDT